MFTNYSREAALYDAETTSYRVDHRTDPAIAAIVALATIAEHCVTKARTLVPNVHRGEHLIAAMYAAKVDDLPELFRSFGADIDDNTAARIVDLFDIDADTFRTYDDSLQTIDDAPFDPTWTRPRITTGRGIEVRGRRDGYVVGDTGDTYVRMPYAEALERANAWHYMTTGETLDLIGTDTYSWEQVVTFRPYRVDRWAMRPEGAGSSLVGDGRKKRTNVPRSVSYGHDRFHVPTALPGWAGGRILKEYRTNVRVRVVDDQGNPVSRSLPDRVAGINHRGEPIHRPVASVAVMGSVRWIGHRVIGRPAVRKTAAVVARAKRAPIVDVVDVDAIAADLTAVIAPAVVDKIATAVAYRLPNGTVIRCKVDPVAAVVAVQVTNVDAAGTKRTERTNVRGSAKVTATAATIAAVRNRIR